MKIHLSGFAATRLGTNFIEYEGKKSRDQILEYIRKLDPVFSGIHFEIAVNSQKATDKTSIADSDKVFVFSPFSGG